MRSGGGAGPRAATYSCTPRGHPTPEPRCRESECSVAHHLFSANPRSTTRACCDHFIPVLRLMLAICRTCLLAIYGAGDDGDKLRNDERKLDVRLARDNDERTLDVRLARSNLGLRGARL